MNAPALRHSAWYAITCCCVVQSWHQARSPHALANSNRATLSANLGPRLLINLAYCLSWWRCRFGPLPILPWPCRRACPSLFRLFSCTSPGHHASPGCVLQRLQRRWRSFWRYSRNRPAMAWTPPPASHRRSGQVHYAHLILHQQPLRTRAHSIALA
jgi:hypothetical protein